MQIDRARRRRLARHWLRILAAAASLLLPAAALAAPTVITEFFNSTLRHYVLITSAAEVAAIEAGAAGPGWQKTGRTIYAHTAANDAPGLVPVCRFYGSITPGPNSHFFTADPDECAAVKTDPGWHYEEIAFYVTLPVDGECDADRVPVWRAYNNGFKPQQGINDGNHRFATDHAITRKLADFGWNDEGIVFCALATTPSVPFAFAGPSSQSLLVPGAARNLFFTIAARNGFAGEVSFATAGLPAGVSAQFVPASVTLGAAPAEVTLRITAAADAPATAENTNVTINGASAGGTAFTGFLLGVAAAGNPEAVQALAVAAVEEKSRALRVQGLKGLPYIQGIAAFMTAHPEYSSVGMDATTLSAWGKFKDGTVHVVSDNLERTAVTPQPIEGLLGGAPGARLKSGAEVPGATKARLLQVFGSGFVGQAPISNMRRFLRSKGWSLRSGADADAFVTSLKGVNGDGFFYLNTHGTHFDVTDPSEPDGMHILWTATLADPDYDRFFAIDRLTLRLVKYTARNFLEPEGAVPQEDTRYAITWRFVKEYMHFEDSSVAWMNSCWSAYPHPAVTKFINTFNDRGAGVYFGWTNLLDFDTAFLSAPWFVDRMVGANLHFDKESPPQRAFSYDLVLKDMARNGLDSSRVTPAKLQAFPKAGLKYPPIFAPSIRYARVNEYDEELVLTGEFGEKVPTVTVGGTQLAVKPGNTATEIKAVLPLTGPGSNGDVVVEVLGVKSNARQLTEWPVPFHYRWDDVAGTPGLKIRSSSTPLRFRADVGRYRLLPHETPHWTSLGGPPTKDSTVGLAGSGTYNDGECTATLTGHADYPTPASPASANGRVLVNFFKLDTQTKTGSVGLAFGELESAHVITVVCPRSSVVQPLPVVLDLLEGTVDFPNGQTDSPTLIPLPALNFTFDAHWGIPKKDFTMFDDSSPINVTLDATPAITPPRDTEDSGK